MSGCLYSSVAESQASQPECYDELFYLGRILMWGCVFPCLHTVLFRFKFYPANKSEEGSELLCPDRLLRLSANVACLLSRH